MKVTVFHWFFHCSRGIRFPKGFWRKWLNLVIFMKLVENGSKSGPFSTHFSENRDFRHFWYDPALNTVKITVFGRFCKNWRGQKSVQKVVFFGKSWKSGNFALFRHFPKKCKTPIQSQRVWRKWPKWHHCTSCSFGLKKCHFRHFPPGLDRGWKLIVR